MPIISVSIVCGARVIRPFGIVSVDGSGTLLNVYELCREKGSASRSDAGAHRHGAGVDMHSDGGTAAGSADDHMDMNKVTATVSTSPTAVFQAIPLNVLVNECIEFGKYIKFIVEMPAKEKTVVNDCFKLMMQSSQQKCLPELKDTSRKNSKFELHNALIKFLNDHELGWRMGSLHFGEDFIGVLCDALWIVDPHRQKFSQQQCEVPSMFIQ